MQDQAVDKMNGSVITNMVWKSEQIKLYLFMYILGC